MTHTSPRSNAQMNGLGCSGIVAGWSPRKERLSQKFDKIVKASDSKIPAPALSKEKPINLKPVLRLISKKVA